MNRRMMIALLPLLIFVPTAAAQMGPNLDLTWNTYDGGGGVSTGGTFTLTGTIGQADAGSLTGGTFNILGGFWGSPATCYPDCNNSGTLTIADFACFQTKFVGLDPYADCNASGTFTIADFACFQTRFVTGCP